MSDILNAPDALSGPALTGYAELAARIDSLERQIESKSNSLSMVVFSGDLDRLLAAFTVATGAAACGMRVSMFFTFWATAALKKRGARSEKSKSFVERLLGWFLPGGFRRQKLSKLDMGGLGRQMIFREMSKKNISGLEELVETANELGVEFKICEMSMSLMGIQPDELLPFANQEICGVATFLDCSSNSNTTLFI